MNLSNITNGIKKVFSFIWIYRELVLVLVILILLFLLIYRKPHNTTTVVTDPLTLQQVKELKDANDQLYVKIKQHTLTEAQKSSIIDSLSKALKIKPKFIQGATIFTTKIDTLYRDTGRIVIVGGDTAHLVQHHDHWIDIEAYAYLNPAKFHLDHIDFKLRDSLYLLFTHKNPLFGKTVDEVVIRSANPSNHIISGASYTLKQKQPWLILSAGIYYNPFAPAGSWKFGPSLNLGYPILSLKR